MTLTAFGIDASLTGTAWCSLRGAGEGVEPAFDSSILPPRDRKGPERLLWIEHQIELVLDLHEPDIVVLEDYAFSRANQAHQIGELGGRLRCLLHQKPYPWVLVAPNARAKFGSGKGNAKKTAVVSAVSARTGIAFNTDDEADAFTLACMALDHYGVRHPLGDLPQTHRDALKKVSWPDLKDHAPA